MKNYPLVLLLLFFSLAVDCQTNGQTDKPRKLQLGFSITPAICYRTLYNNDGTDITAQIIDLRNDRETPSVGYQAAFSVGYQFKPWVALESGVQFTDHRYSTKFIDLFSIDPEPGLPAKAKSCYNMYFIDLPVKVNFYAGKHKVRFMGSAGAEANFFLAEMQKMVLKYDDGHIENRRSRQHFDYRNVLLTLVAAAGIEYQFTPRLSLRVLPVFRYEVLRIIDTPITSQLWGGGLQTGLTLRL